jgi:hypothetical protein
MAQEEIYGTRDRTYSAWHRRLSTGRFVGIEQAQTLAMIDLDATLFVECRDGDYEPLALIETAIDKGQPFKPATMTRNLSKATFTNCPNCHFKSNRDGIPAYCLLYKISDGPNPKYPETNDISGFRVKRIWPKPESAFREITPAEWTKALVKLREWSARRVDQLLGFEDAA